MQLKNKNMAPPRISYNPNDLKDTPPPPGLPMTMQDGIYYEYCTNNFV